MEKGLIPISDRVRAVIESADVLEGERAVALRRRHKLTLANVSAATGIHPHQISEMERGVRDVSEKYTVFLTKLKH